MNLFRLARFFQPLQNPAGFGVVDFIALGLALLLVVFFLAQPRLAPSVVRFAARTRLCMAALAALTVLLRLAILPVQPVAAPRVADDFSYLLSGDTLAHFRLVNPMHPMHRFFEGVFTMQEPSWSSVYPLGQGLALALGQLVFGTPWAGVVLSCAALSALCYWMLLGWTTPAWALAGGLLAVIQFGPLSAWMNLYWGGAVSAVAGCLIFGALPRLRDGTSPRNALLLGAGLGLQLLCRPYESIFVGAAVAIYALAFLRHHPRRTFLCMIALLSLLPASALTLLQNKQVTGHWNTHPFIASRARYGIPTTFAFQSVPIPQGPLTIEQQINYDAQVAVHGNTPETFSTWLTRLLKRVAFYRFFFLAPLYLVLPAFLFSLRDRLYGWVVATLLLLACGTTFYVYFYPHYIAVATCLFVLIGVNGLQNLSRLTLRGIPAGREAARLILALCFAHFLFWYGIYAWGDTNILRALSPFEHQYAIASGDPDGRLAIADQLAHAPGQHLVFVRYSPQHNGDPWVHNAADIDQSHVVWALDLGEREDAELIRYYPTRTAWVLDPDSRPPRLTPYSVTAP
jgi:hypothetical protein